MLSNKLKGVKSGETLPPVDPDLVLVVDTSLGDGTPTVGVELAGGSMNATVNWGDGLTDTYNTVGYKTHTYATGGIYTIRISGSLTSFGGNTATHNAKITKCLSFGTLGLTSLFNAFYFASNLNEVPSVLPSTVTDLQQCFYYATGTIGSNIESWNTVNVINMNRAFEGATAFNQNIGSWNTSNVLTFAYMFSGASAFNQNIGSWNTSKATNMSGMFYGTTAFNQDISGWDTSNVTNTSDMFWLASSFNQPIGSWNVMNVINMSNMFNGATVFDQNLSTWCVGNFQSQPSNFSASSALSESNKPVWGTCPLYEPDGDIIYLGSSSGVGGAALPAHQAGDVIIAFAINDGSNSMSVPTGWTQINAGGLNLIAMRLMYRVATSSSTTSGAWGSTSIIFSVYRNCTTVIPAVVSSTATLNNTNIQYNAVNHWKNLAWTLAFGGTRSTNTTIENPPTGVILRLNVLDAVDEAAAFDSNGITTGFTSQSRGIGGTAGATISATLRLRPKLKLIGT